MRLDPEAAAEIYQCAGKTAQVELRNTAAVFTFLIRADAVELLDETPDTVDTRIRGTPLALLGALLGAARARRGEEATMHGDVEIVGDIHLAQQLTAALGKMEIDWEERLSALTGDAIARKSARLFRDGADLLQDVRGKLERDAGEYLLVEKEAVADGDELQDFHRAVDTLRDDVERLKRRVAGLEREPGAARRPG